MDKKLFEKYYSRLTADGIVKSLVCGIISGLGVALLISLISYIVGFNPLWYTIGLGLGATISVTLALFFLKFRPTEKRTAERIDRLGLEERLVTMLELEGDDTYIAKVQREDAKDKLRNVKRESIKISISSTVIAFIVMLAVFVSSITLVSTLSAKGDIGYLPGFGTGGGAGSRELFQVTYKVIGVKGDQAFEDEGGFIQGAIEQFVLRDEDASTVVAIAQEGWFFDRWLEDEKNDPERTDKKIQGNVTYTAVFVEMGEGGGPGEGEGEGEGEPQENQEPAEPSEGDEGEGEGEGEDDNQNGGGAGGKYDPANSVIDGNTYYREVIEQLYKALESGKELTPQQRAMLEAYLKTIA